MDCDTAREATSAALDNEPPVVSPATLERHLAVCPDCRAWREAAHAVTRRARIGPARAGLEPPDALLAAIAFAADRPRRWSSGPATRLALVVIALVQLAVTLPMLILGTDGDAPVHVAHEMGSFDAALAVGFLVAAWRPASARGMCTLVGAAALLLVVTAVIDLVGGRTQWADEAPHLLAVVGWVLLRRVAGGVATREARPGGGLVALLLRRARPAALGPVRGVRR